MRRIVQCLLKGSACVCLYLMTAFSAGAQEHDGIRHSAEITDSSLSEQDREIVEQLDLIEHLDLLMQDDVEMLEALELLLTNS